MPLATTTSPRPSTSLDLTDLRFKTFAETPLSPTAAAEVGGPLDLVVDGDVTAAAMVMDTAVEPEGEVVTTAEDLVIWLGSVLRALPPVAAAAAAAITAVRLATSPENAEVAAVVVVVVVVGLGVRVTVVAGLATSLGIAARLLVASGEASAAGGLVAALVVGAIIVEIQATLQGNALTGLERRVTYSVLVLNFNYCG